MFDVGEILVKEVCCIGIFVFFWVLVWVVWRRIGRMGFFGRSGCIVVGRGSWLWGSFAVRSWIGGCCRFCW